MAFLFVKSGIHFMIIHYSKNWRLVVYCYAGARVACVSVIQYSEYLLRIFICDIYERTSL